MALKDNLVSHWKLEEASGTRVDAHGSNDLTDNNTVTQATGKIDNAAHFELDNSETLSITDASQTGLDITGDMSIGLWANFETLPSGATMIFASKWTFADGDRAYAFGLEEDGDEKLTFEQSSDGTANTAQDVLWTPSTATWYYVVVTYNATSQDIKFYVDGSQQGTTQTSNYTSMQNNDQPFILGAWNGTTSLFDGSMDEVSIWSREITSGEVSEIYNSGNGLAFDDWDAAAAAGAPPMNMLGVGG